MDRKKAPGIKLGAFVLQEAGGYSGWLGDPFLLAHPHGLGPGFDLCFPFSGDPDADTHVATGSLPGCVVLDPDDSFGIFAHGVPPQ